jgi:hypothetical protein
MTLVSLKIPDDMLELAKATSERKLGKKNFSQYVRMLIAKDNQKQNAPNTK